MLNVNLREKIKSHALENINVECCGLVLESGNSTFVYKCKNISSHNKLHFEISPLDYLRAWDEGKNKIIGFYHSQKLAKPSMLDIVMHKNHKLPSYIYSIDANDFIEVTDGHLKYGGYLGKEFEIGKQDCFTLVRDFYLKEHNITIVDLYRDDKLLENCGNIAENIYDKEGFAKVESGDVKEGNIIEFRNNHFGIYLEGDLLLHHQRNKFSNVDRFNDIWKSRVLNCYRYAKSS